MTEPTTAAGREREECGECSRTEGEGHAPDCSGRAEARQQDGSALRSVAQAVVLAATKHTPEIVALNRILAALPPSAPPALDVEARVLAFLVVRDRQARDGVEQENRWTLPDALWESLDKYQREGWRDLAAEYARLQELAR